MRVFSIPYRAQNVLEQTNDIPVHEIMKNIVPVREILINIIPVGDIVKTLFSS